MKQILTIMTIWKVCLNVIFEITYSRFCIYSYQPLLYDISFLLYLLALNYPITHNIIFISERFDKSKKSFHLGRVVSNIYFILLFINTFYYNNVFMALRWFCLIFYLIYLLNSVRNLNIEKSAQKTGKENGFIFQITCFEFWILMACICSFGNNTMSIVISLIYIIFSEIIRIMVLRNNQKTDHKIHGITVKFIFAVLIEFIAFLLFFWGVPFSDMDTFYEEIYLNNPTIYIDMLLLLIVCCLCEVPIYCISNQLRKKRD